MKQQAVIFRYLRMRIFRLASILLAVSFITFLLLDFVPGDAAELLLRNELQTSSPEQAAALRQELGLDAPIPLRWLRWLGRAAVLDFGTSFRSGEPVSHELLRLLPHSQHGDGGRHNCRAVSEPAAG